VAIEGPLAVTANPGQTIRLNGSVMDPDGNAVSIKWWPFQVGTYPGKVSFSDVSSPVVRVSIPKDAVPGQTIHVVLEATDNGSPSLVAYQRVVITVK
jgi:hypothetical protein